jgi:hypothetical protein
MFATGALETICGFPPQAEIETMKLISYGHSYGAATSLRYGEQDDRVQLVICHDPMFLFNLDMIDNVKNLLTKRLLCIHSMWQIYEDLYHGQMEK